MLPKPEFIKSCPSPVQGLNATPPTGSPLDGEGPPRLAQREDLRQRFGGCRVLVADNNRVSQALARRLLVQAGLAVTWADDGEQAVARVGSDRFTLILMDLQMPRLDGWQAAQAIRAMPLARQPAIIAVTSQADAASHQRCLQVGMDDLLAKPYSTRGLYEMLLRWLPGAGLTSP